MASLFLDTTYHLIFGLLSDDGKWIDYFEDSNKKNSPSFHYEISKRLKVNGLSVKEIRYIFQVSGPGSYTGIRLAESIKQVFSWRGVISYSFYHFQVPYFLGIKSGLWMANAFKNDIYYYFWNDTGKFTVDKGLINSEKLSSLLETRFKKCNYYTHNKEDSWEQKILEKNKSINNTSELILNHSEDLFFKIRELNKKEPLFYYRSSEQEFKPSVSS